MSTKRAKSTKRARKRDLVGLADQGLSRSAHTSHTAQVTSFGRTNGILEEISQKARNGEDVVALRAELTARLLPIYQRRARQAARQIGPFADAAEIESRVLERVWRLIDKSDLDDPVELAKLLSVCESRARKDASRAADHLARATRSLVREYTVRAERATQLAGRSLSYSERLAIARQVAPEGSDTSMLQRIIAGSPSVVSADELVDSASSLLATPVTPESSLVREEERSVVEEWLANLPRKADRRVLERRLSGEHPMSAPLSVYLRERAIKNGATEVAESVLS